MFSTLVRINKTIVIIGCISNRSLSIRGLHLYNALQKLRKDTELLNAKYCGLCFSVYVSQYNYLFLYRYSVGGLVVKSFAGYGNGTNRFYFNKNARYDLYIIISTPTKTYL